MPAIEQDDRFYPPHDREEKPAPKASKDSNRTIVITYKGGTEGTFNKGQWFTIAYNHLNQMASGVMPIRDTPQTVDPFYLQSALMHRGGCAFFRDPQNRCIYAVHGVLMGGIDHYDNYTQFMPTPLNNKLGIDLQRFEEEKKKEKKQKKFREKFLKKYSDKPYMSLFRVMDISQPYDHFYDPYDCIIMHNFSDSYATGRGVRNFRPLEPEMRTLANAIADIMVTISIRQEKERMPYLISITQDNARAVELLDQIRSGEPVVLIKKGSGSDINMMQDTSDLIDVMNLTTTYVLDKLADHTSFYYNIGKMLLGRDYASVDKKERVNLYEVASNNDELNAIRTSIYDARSYACDHMNKVWGTKMYVDRGEMLNTNDDRVLAYQRPIDVSKPRTIESKEDTDDTDDTAG